MRGSRGHSTGRPATRTKSPGVWFCSNPGTAFIRFAPGKSSAPTCRSSTTKQRRGGWYGANPGPTGAITSAAVRHRASPL